jgi:hypothetical protein
MIYHSNPYNDNFMLIIVVALPSLMSVPAAGTGAAAAQKDSSLVDPNSGVTLDYCGKSHADEGKRRGIRRKLNGILWFQKPVY